MGCLLHEFFSCLSPLQAADGVLISREQAYEAIQGMMQASLQDRWAAVVAVGCPVHETFEAVVS